MDWSRLHTELVWAYKGNPVVRQCHRFEYDMLMCWLMLEGHVKAHSSSCGWIEAKAGQWLFMPHDKDEHIFSDNAKIISLRLVIHWPNDQHLYPYDQWIRIDSLDHPHLERQANQLVKAAGKIMKLDTSLGIASTELATLSCDFADYMTMKQATYRWVMLYDQTMQKIGMQRTPLEKIDARVNRALKIIDRLPPDRKFEEETLGKTVGLSVGQLIRLFSQAIGQTPKAYAEKLRINDTIKLLISSNIPLKQLAYTMGFKQQSHFANWFHKKTGKYPREYRKQHQAPVQDQIFETLKTR